MSLLNQRITIHSGIFILLNEFTICYNSTGNTRVDLLRDINKQFFEHSNLTFNWNEDVDAGR